MGYSATVRNQNYRVELERQDHQVNVRINDSVQALDWRRIASLAAPGTRHGDEEGRYSLLIDGRSYEVFARRLPQTGDQEQTTYEIWLAGERFEVTVEDERTRLLSGIARGTASAAATVQAPMPGLVTAVLVEPGSSVSQGQPLIILEAMKMENDLPAPIAGTVRKVNVSQGQTVDQGEVLVVIEGSPL